MERVEQPSAANNTMRARSLTPCSVFGDRTMLSSTARSSSVNMIGVASWMFIHPLNHDSAASDSRY